MKNLLLVLVAAFCFSLKSQTPHPYVDQFDSFGDVGEWSLVTGQGNTGSHGGLLCYNVTGNYLDGVYYSFESPVLNISTWIDAELEFAMEKNLRNGDKFYLFYYDNGWFYFDLTTLANGTYIAPIPITTTLLSFDLETSGNGGLNGKYAHIDFVRLSDPNQSLPVELISFEGEEDNGNNVIKWATASERNSEYFELQKTSNPENWETINIVPAAQNSVQYIEYVVFDYNVDNTTNYYRLIQYDIDGLSEMFGPIAIDNNKKTLQIVRYVNMLGQEVNPLTTKGVIMVIFEDGSSTKYIR